MFKVTKDFVDLQDGEHLYRTGDNYPREGAVAPSEDRLEQLAQGKNVFAERFIEEVQDADAETVETEVKETKKATTRAKK